MLFSSLALVGRLGQIYVFEILASAEGSKEPVVLSRSVLREFTLQRERDGFYEYSR